MLQGATRGKTQSFFKKACVFFDENLLKESLLKRLSLIKKNILNHNIYIYLIVKSLYIEKWIDGS
jgi:hypothetical protein